MITQLIIDTPDAVSFTVVTKLEDGTFLEIIDGDDPVDMEDDNPESPDFNPAEDVRQNWILISKMLEIFTKLKFCDKRPGPIFRTTMLILQADLAQILKMMSIM